MTQPLYFVSRRAWVRGGAQWLQAAVLAPPLVRSLGLSLVAAGGATGLGACGGKLSDNAELESLALSAGTLQPAFSASVQQYAVSVPNTTTTISFTPRAADDAADVRVQDARVRRGDASPAFSLAVGVNTFNIQVSAEDGKAQRLYTVQVVRADVPTSSDASLAALVVSQGTLEPAFSPAVTVYAVAVASTVDKISITPFSSKGARSITINATAVQDGIASQQPLQTGANNFDIVVTSQDGSTLRSYKVTVTRAA
jgi:hypothetical protein